MGRSLPPKLWSGWAARSPLRLVLRPQLALHSGWLTPARLATEPPWLTRAPPG